MRDGIRGFFVLAGPAAAQDVATAKALFDQARSLMGQNNYEMTCPKLAESHRLDPRAGTLFTLAVCESYVIGGVGLAGLVAGGVTGGLALGKKSVIEEHCGAGIGSADKAACDQTGLDAGQSVKTLGLVSTIGLVAGVAGVGTGAVLLLTAPKAAQPATGARPEWIRAGVLAAGPQGTLVGLTGAW